MLETEYSIIGHVCKLRVWMARKSVEWYEYCGGPRINSFAPEIA